MPKLTDICKHKTPEVTDAILTGFDRHCILGNKSRGSETARFVSLLAGAWADGIPDAPEAYDDLISVCRDTGFEEILPKLLEMIMFEGNDVALGELCRILETYPEISEECEKLF